MMPHKVCGGTQGSVIHSSPEFNGFATYLELLSPSSSQIAVGRVYVHVYICMLINMRKKMSFSLSFL